MTRTPLSKPLPPSTPQVVRWYARWYVIAAFSVVAALLFIGLRLGFEMFRVPSSAMYPTIPVGALMVVDKAAFGRYGIGRDTLFRSTAGAGAERGDIVVFSHAPNPGELWVKRVIGLPGDSIEIRADGGLLINGAAVKQEDAGGDREHIFLRESGNGAGHLIARYRAQKFQSPTGTWQVPEAHYFVVGDNRDNSLDSRHGWFVPDHDLVGRVRWIFGAPDTAAN